MIFLKVLLVGLVSLWTGQQNMGHFLHTILWMNDIDICMYIFLFINRNSHLTYKKNIEISYSK
jgi:hypothetical protein